MRSLMRRLRLLVPAGWILVPIENFVSHKWLLTAGWTAGAFAWAMQWWVEPLSRGIRNRTRART